MSNIGAFGEISVYHLDGKYYQKLGEVWDHETKDFKIFYKPLYNCGSKVGSFEAHYLAVSTFERWNSKFHFVSDLSSIPAEVTPFIVPQIATAQLANGNTAFPLTTNVIPPPIAANKGSVQVPSLPSKILGTSSGYGTRSHVPYFILDFAPEFKDMITKGIKTATTRVLRRRIDGSEPVLYGLVEALRSDSRGDVPVRATCTDKDGCHIFALLNVSRVEEQSVRDITLELARKENFESVEEFVFCLRQFYPSLALDDVVYTFYFTLADS